MGGKRNIRCGKNRTSKSGFLFQGLVNAQKTTHYVNMSLQKTPLWKNRETFILTPHILIVFLLCVKLSSAASDVINSRWEYSQQKSARGNTCCARARRHAGAGGEQVRLAFWHVSSKKLNLVRTALLRKHVLQNVQRWIYYQGRWKWLTYVRQRKRCVPQKCFSSMNKMPMFSEGPSSSIPSISWRHHWFIPFD